MPLSATDQSKLTRLRYEHAALAFQSALLNLGMVLDHAYRPDQPRVFAGHPNGEQARLSRDTNIMDDLLCAMIKPEKFCK